MKNIKRIFNDSKDLNSFITGYLEHISELLNRMNIQSITSFIEQLEEARNSQNTIFIIGNGGSAATASHMANDFALGSRIEENKNPYRVLSLVDNTAMITAISNDYGYDRLFVDQLKAHYRPGDKLVAISASGNSQNVIAAAKWVKEQGGMVIGLSGFDGGKLKDICDISIHVATPKGEYGPVEDIHMIMDHLIYTWLHYKNKKANPK